MIIKPLSVHGINSQFWFVFWFCVHGLVVCFVLNLVFFFFLSQDLYEKLQCNVDTAFLMTK